MKSVLEGAWRPRTDPSSVGGRRPSPEATGALWVQGVESTARTAPPPPRDYKSQGAAREPGVAAFSGDSPRGKITWGIVLSVCPPAPLGEENAESRHGGLCAYRELLVGQQNVVQRKKVLLRPQLPRLHPEISLRHGGDSSFSASTALFGEPGCKRRRRSWSALWGLRGRCSRGAGLKFFPRRRRDQTKAVDPCESVQAEAIDKACGFADLVRRDPWRVSSRQVDQKCSDCSPMWEPEKEAGHAHWSGRMCMYEIVSTWSFKCLGEIKNTLHQVWGLKNEYHCALHPRPDQVRPLDYSFVTVHLR